MKQRVVFIGFIMFMAVLMTAFVVHADDLTFSWQPVTTNLDGSSVATPVTYRLYVSEWPNPFYNFGTPWWEGSTTACDRIINAAVTHSFVVTAVDALGTESGPSNEVYYPALPVPAPNAPDGLIVTGSP